MARILIGTSGWTYRSWRGPFFPETMATQDYLQFYASQFSTTELNSVFYRTPTTEAVRAWRNSTPDDFIFAWKASRFITHWKRLSDKSRNSLALMATRLRILEVKAGRVLFQLPPQFTANCDRLASFIKLLKPTWRYSFEFRHPSWFTSKTFELLKDHDISLCLSDHHDAPTPWEVTASFVYIRGHGPKGSYEGQYSEAALRSWADRIVKLKRGRRDVFVYFDNDQKSAAPKDAARLIQLVASHAR